MNELISSTEAAHILGFKQVTPIMNYVKSGHLTSHSKNGSNRKFFLKKDIFDLPKALPVPPPPDKFKGHGRPTLN
jgi:hypothetical protein